MVESEYLKNKGECEMNEKTGYTTEQAVESELYSLGEAIGNSLELNNEFLDGYCSDTVNIALSMLTSEQDRAYAIEGCIGEGREAGYEAINGDSILLPVGEIEEQFEGKPEEYFEEPENWAINGDLAYYPMIGAYFSVDIVQLRENVNDILKGE